MKPRLDDIERQIDRLPLADPAEGHVPPNRSIPEPSAASASHAYPTRSQRTARGRWMLLLAIGWIVAVVFAFGGARPGLAVLMHGGLGAQVGLWCLAAAVAARLGWTSASPLGPSVWAVRVAAVGLPFVSILLSMAISLSDDPAAAVLAAGSASAAKAPAQATLDCLLLTLLLWAGPLALASIHVRSAFATSAGWRGATVGAVCGASAAVAMQLHCPIAGVSHVAWGHALPVALAATAGAWLGRRYARI